MMTKSPNRARPGPRLVALATVLILLTSALVDLAAAGVSVGDVECCCGEHPGDEACGCIDCPSGHHGDRDRGPSDGVPRIAACGPDLALVLPAALVDAALPEPGVVVGWRRACVAAHAPPIEPRSTSAPPPEPPPPRSARRAL